jgi:hypothetical protein
LELCLQCGLSSSDGLLISSVILALGLLWHTLAGRMLDNFLTWLTDTFRSGIQSMPSYQLGDQVAMLVDTKDDLDNLPTTESEEDQ